MDSVESYKEKLAYFDIKDLKYILMYIGLPRDATKQDLVGRILEILSTNMVGWSDTKEKVASLIDDTYRKIKVSGEADLASKSNASSDDVKLKEVKKLEQVPILRCFCMKDPSDSMIQCGDPSCGVWKHMACVLISENPQNGIIPSPPDVFYCELCRLNRADPFWETVVHPLFPVELKLERIPADDHQSTEWTFRLTRSEWELLSKQDYDVQAWSMLLNDDVLFRIQWPQYADLWINGVPVKVIERPPDILLGPNDRDDGPLITPFMRDGINKILLQARDTRKFFMGVRIVKRRTLNQVLSMIPKEADGEPFEEALARVRRCVGGREASEYADSDSDVEVVADLIRVNLRCPISGVRIKVAGRFKRCPHMGGFDLEVYVEMNQRTRKWQCPICLKNYSWDEIVIDPFFNRTTSKMRDLSDDVAATEVKPDGSWRAKSEGDGEELGELGMWHSPDGTICSSPCAESEQKQDRKVIVLTDSDDKTKVCSSESGQQPDAEVNPNEFADKCRIGTESDA